MSLSPIRALTLEVPESIDLRQATRYLGAPGEPDSGTLALLERCAPPLLHAAMPKAVWRTADTAAWDEAGILQGADIRRHLTECPQAILLAVTLGPMVDSQIRRSAVGDVAAGAAADALASALAKIMQSASTGGVTYGGSANAAYAPLMKAVEQGLKGEAATAARTLLREKEPLELVDGALIPALDAVGAKYENGTLFLPQLLQAASAAQSAFDEVKTAMAAKGGEGAGKGRIVLATVHGDVHDIGKNIVKVILENYGFEVIDLGRDVPVEAVVDAVRDKDVHLVGLSALMTTTLKSMEETIAALRQAQLPCKIMAGGAVLTPEYAKKIGADYYAKDAKQSADIAKSFFSVG